MASPFPGMNPYLEQDAVWQDFHQGFIIALRDLLNAQVRPAYVARAEELLFIHELASEDRRLLGRGDVAVAEQPGTVDPRPRGDTLLAPAYGLLPTAVDVERHSYLEIRDRRGRDVVTVIEVLSPSNKQPGADREQYLAKRRQLFRGGSHVVELDLLRGWPRLPLEHRPEADYYAFVSRMEQRPRVGIWPIALRDPLPLLPIPLRDPDPDAKLDLKQALDRAYDGAGYEDDIYTGAPQPPLGPEDAAWARQFIPPCPDAR